MPRLRMTIEYDEKYNLEVRKALSNINDNANMNFKTSKVYGPRVKQGPCFIYYKGAPYNFHLNTDRHPFPYKSKSSAKYFLKSIKSKNYQVADIQYSTNPKDYKIK